MSPSLRQMRAFVALAKTGSFTLAAEYLHVTQSALSGLIKELESVLGVPARRTHQFELQSVQRKTFTYRCKCQEHQLTVRRHNRVIRGEATYRCVHCGEPLIAE